MYHVLVDKVIANLASLYATAKAVELSPIADLKSIFEGEPEKLGESDLPALIIQPRATSWRGTGKSGSQYDVREGGVRMTLILPRKKFYASNYGSGGNSKKVFVEKKAAQMAEAVDNSQHADINSVVGVVQNNQTLTVSGVKACSMALIDMVNYDVPPPRPRGIDTYEVTVDAVVTIRGNRS